MGVEGLSNLQRAASTLHSHLVSRGVPAVGNGAVGSPHWFGTGLRPSIFVLGARDSGADAVGDFVLAQPGACGGATRLFDDDLRYVSGLSTAVARFKRKTNVLMARNASDARQPFLNRRISSFSCSLFVDTSNYLHSRWAPLRVHSILRVDRARFRFIVVLRDPTERAVRHWRSLQASAVRAPVRYVVQRGVAESAALKLNDLNIYLNGSSFLKKVKQEVAKLHKCFEDQRVAHKSESAIGITPAQWVVCTTLACNWFECIVGTGLYAPQLRGWLQYFGHEQFLIFEARQLHSKPTEVASAIRAFLRLPHVSSPQPPFGHDNNSDLVIGDQAKRLMQRFYSDHNKHLRSLLHEIAPGGAWSEAKWLS